MEIQGTVKKVCKAVTFTSKTGSEFTKRTLLVTIGDKYPEHVPVEFFQDKVTLLDHVKEGDDITVQVNLKGSEYKEKYYSSISGWKIGDSESSASFADQATTSSSSADDDLPF